MNEQKRPPFNRICRIRTKDGGEYEAKYIKLNRYAGKLERWRREGDVPRKERYIRPAEVVGWEEERMSVSKWAYDPDLCDGKPCPGDCDICYEKLVSVMEFSDEEVTGQLPSIRKEQSDE